MLSLLQRVCLSNAYPRTIVLITKEKPIIQLKNGCTFFIFVRVHIKESLHGYFPGTIASGSANVLLYIRLNPCYYR